MLNKYEVRMRKDKSGKRKKRFENKGEQSDTASKIDQRRKKSK